MLKSVKRSKVSDHFFLHDIIIGMNVFFPQANLKLFQYTQSHHVHNSALFQIIA